MSDGSSDKPGDNPGAQLRELETLAARIEGQARVERGAEVAELGLSQYADVELVGRLRGSAGQTVALSLIDGSRVRGKLAEVGDDWVLVADVSSVLIPLGAVTSAVGVADRAIPEAALGIRDRRRIGSVLRQLVVEQSPVVVSMVGGDAFRGRLIRVGSDFVEIAGDERIALLRLDRVVSVKL